MKHLIMRYDFSGSDQTHRLNSFPDFGRNIIFNDHSDHNRYLTMFPMIKEANSEFIPVGSFIQRILMPDY